MSDWFNSAALWIATSSRRRIRERRGNINGGKLLKSWQVSNETWLISPKQAGKPRQEKKKPER